MWETLKLFPLIFVASICSLVHFPMKSSRGKISARLLAEFSHGTPQNRLLSVKRDFHEPATYLAILDAEIWRVKYRQFTPRSANKIAKCLPSISGLS